MSIDTYDTFILTLLYYIYPLTLLYIIIGETTPKSSNEEQAVVTGSGRDNSRSEYIEHKMCTTYYLSLFSHYYTY